MGAGIYGQRKLAKLMSLSLTDDGMDADPETDNENAFGTILGYEIPLYTGP